MSALEKCSDAIFAVSVTTHDDQVVWLSEESRLAIARAVLMAVMDASEGQSHIGDAIWKGRLQAILNEGPK